MANFGTDPSSEDNWTIQEPHANDDDEIDGDDGIDSDDGDANEDGEDDDDK